MNFITCKLYLSEVDYRERQALEENGGQTPQANKWNKYRKTTMGQRTCPSGWSGRSGVVHNILLRARLYSIDQLRVYTSNNTLYFIRNSQKWRQINPSPSSMGHMPLHSPNGGKINQKMKNREAKLPSKRRCKVRGFISLLPHSPIKVSATPQPFGDCS